MMGQIKVSAEKAGWLAVGCDKLKNRVISPCKIAGCFTATGWWGSAVKIWSTARWL